MEDKKEQKQETPEERAERQELNRRMFEWFYGYCGQMETTVLC